MRPQPPTELLSGVRDCFVPSEELQVWAFETFIEEGAPLHNPDHSHLSDAKLGMIWTNVPNAKNMRSVAGQAEKMPPMAMGKWQRARAAAQIEGWFGELPDFLLTFDAGAASVMDDASFCALVEHELYHCGQEIDQYGMPKFRTDGRPAFAIRGHDVEEFVGVVSRYGAAASGVEQMVEAAARRPLIGEASIAGVCGTCLARVA